jgi:phosphatidylglycerophosphatase A
VKSSAGKDCACSIHTARRSASRRLGSTISRVADFRFLFAHPAHFFALGFGTGLIPKAPGTFGTLAGFVVYWLLTRLPAQAFWPALLLLFLLGIWICGVTGRALGVADHSGMVWDEIVAFALVLAFAPATLAWWVAAFTLFRLFDIWKPFPIRYFDRTVKGGFGVMFDDLLAAVYAIAVLLIAQKLLP